MTQLLLRLFVPDYQDSSKPGVRSAVGKLAGMTGILCNIILFAGKLFAGILAGSVSIIADAMNNLSDASSSIVTLAGFRLAEKPADEEHPYGHARYEYLAGLAVAAIIIIIGFELAKSAVDKMLHPSAVSFTIITTIILLVSMLVKLWMMHFNHTLGQKIHSTTLEAASIDSRNDVLATGAVLFAGIVQKLTSWQIDGIVGLAVALFILYSGVQLALETVSPLLGESTSPELRDLIVDYISTDPRVLGYHDLMVHDYGPNKRFASLHVEMDQRIDPLLCHSIIDDLERECLASHGIHLVIHYDPLVVDDPDLNRMHKSVEQVLKQISPELKTHDFRMCKTPTHINLIFDVSLPMDFVGQEKRIQNRIEQALSLKENTTVYTVITFDPMAFNREEE
ncbi:MAG: cation transporter [Peptococcaceae bacterium]|nr:cation transporter [Peptococcaceae bacterium]